MPRRKFLLSLAAAVAVANSLHADPLSRKTDIDFFRDVPSRNLKGLATRSDGRLVAGPALTDIQAPAPADILWALEPGGTPNTFLLGTGPDGKIAEITLDPKNPAAPFTSREIVTLDDPQVFALERLADGALLAGTSPKGALYLIRDGKPVARAPLPVDSIFDLLLLDANTALAATGNPGRIYKIDLEKFATAGVIVDKITDAKILADRGITLFGEIRDRNVRRLAVLADGRIAAGSAPKGNIYTFPREGGAPFVLQENREAEVTDLLPQPNGDLYAALVFSGSSGESRITPSGGNRPKDSDTPPPAQIEKFGGRTSIVWFPAGGFPEVLASRNNLAFYRLARHGDTLIAAGGEQGDLLGYDLKARLSLSFPGSVSAQVNDMVPLPQAPGKFLLLRNNAPGLAVLDFDAAGPREAETRRLDLGNPAQIGALRFNRLRNITDANLKLDIRVSNGSDDLEGWSEWQPLTASADGGWRPENLRGRYVRLRLQVPPTPADGGAVPPPRNAKSTKSTNASSASPAPTTTSPNFEIDRAALFALPQNRRPQLQDFRVLTPNFGLIVAPDQPPPPNVSLNQLMSNTRDDDAGGKRKGNFLSSQVVPVTGAQVVLWTVTDPDGDSFTCTFSIRRDGDENWTDISANTTDSFAQFDTAHLSDGVYFTRLVATEIAPRPVEDRLTQNFETDDLIIDHTAPEIAEATTQRRDNSVVITVRGRDQLSLLDGIEVIFNNNARETVEQPVDGIRDGREETFSLDVPLARISNATSVEVTLYDAAGNATARRLTW